MTKAPYYIVDAALNPVWFNMLGQPCKKGPMATLRFSSKAVAEHIASQSGLSGWSLEYAND